MSRQNAHSRKAEISGQRVMSSQHLSQECKPLESPVKQSAPTQRFQVLAHTGKVNAILGTPDGKYIVTAGEDNSLGIISCHSGTLVRKFTRHTRKVADIALLDEDTIVSVSADRSARVWSISQSRELRTILLTLPASAVVSLPDGRFAVGMRAGYVSINSKHPLDASLKLGPVKTYETAPGQNIDIVDLCVTERYLVAASMEGTISFWDVKSFQLCKSSTFEEGNFFRTWKIKSLSMRGNQIAVCHGNQHNSKGIIRIYELGTSRTMKRLKRIVPVANFLPAVGPESNILYMSMTSIQYSVHVQNLLTKPDTEPVTFSFSKLAVGQPQLGASSLDSYQIECSSFCSNGYFFFGLKNGMVDVIPPPPELVPFLRTKNSESKNARGPVSNPLYKALSSYESEGTFSVESLVTLICYNNCAMSFREWNSAHKLLEHAVKEGRIPGQTSFNQKSNYWFQNLYIALQDVKLASDDELEIATKCLSSAKIMGLIESSETTLAAYRTLKAILDIALSLHANVSALDERISFQADVMARRSRRDANLAGVEGVFAVSEALANIGGSTF